MEFQRFC